MPNSNSNCLRVLIADDERDNADSCAMLLGIAGHEVRSVYSGAEALMAAASFRPHMAFLDIAMPDVSGYDVARAIRAADWGREMVLVAVTGWAREMDKRRATESGFDHHLVKPVGFESLQAVLAQCAGSGSGSGEGSG